MPGGGVFGESTFRSIDLNFLIKHILLLHKRFTNRMSRKLEQSRMSPNLMTIRFQRNTLHRSISPSCPQLISTLRLIPTFPHRRQRRRRNFFPPRLYRRSLSRFLMCTNSRRTYNRLLPLCDQRILSRQFRVICRGGFCRFLGFDGRFGDVLVRGWNSEVWGLGVIGGGDGEGGGGGRG